MDTFLGIVAVLIVIAGLWMLLNGVSNID